MSTVKRGEKNGGAPSSPLERYRKKRDFASSPEPSGMRRMGSAGAPTGDSNEEESQFPRFVVQEHAARSLHWDLRLERDGVLVSWAVPKGPPLKPGIRRLAVRTEDHPLEYLSFEGEIPPGQYGAGTVEIWDTGHYAPAKWREGEEVIFAVLGRKMQGGYALIHTDGDHWLLLKMERDPVVRMDKT